MGASILVVDDEPLILKTIERALAKMGYRVATAQNLSELQDQLVNAPFDLLLTDVYLEDAHASDIIQKVRGVSPLVKVLRMSGSGSLAKGDDFIEKPFLIDKLREKIRHVLHEPS